MKNSLATLVGAVAITSIAVAAARPGKVVRVERATGKAEKALKVCIKQGSRGFTCITPMQVGDSLHVLSESGGYERVEVTSVRPSHLDTCKLGQFVDIGVRVLDTISTTRTRRLELAFGGVDAVPGVARLTMDPSNIKSPSHSQQIVLAASLRGDPGPELLVTERRCPETRSKDPRLSAKNVRRSTCHSFWLRVDSRWKHALDVATHDCR